MSGYERIARAFHGVYETLAPEYGYESRPESRVPWAEVPEKNRALMIGTVRRLAETGVISLPTVSTQQQSGQLQELLEAVDRHRDELDGRALGRTICGETRTRDDVDNDLYNAATRLRSIIQQSKGEAT